MERIVERELELDGAALRYLAAGDRGPSLLLLHGWADGAVVWRRTMERWADDFRVVAPDLPGFGGSTPTPASGGMTALRARLQALAAATLSGPVTLVGHSLGGLLSLQMALEEPGWVRALVLVNPAWNGRRIRAQVPPPLRSHRSALPLLVAARPLHALLVGTAGPLLARGGPRRQAQLARWRCYDQVEPWWLARTLQMLLESRLPAPVEQVAQPVLVVAGGRDRTVPPEGSEALVGRLPQGRIARLPRSGHHPMEDDPDGFQSHVLPFLADQTGGDDHPE